MWIGSLGQRNLDPVGGRLSRCRKKRKMQCRRRRPDPKPTVTGL